MRPALLVLFVLSLLSGTVLALAAVIPARASLVAVRPLE